MSAFYVGEKHLNWLLGYAQAIGFELSFPARKVGEILSKENDYLSISSLLHHNFQSLFVQKFLDHL